MAEQRLPRVNNDDGSWGTILNQYIVKEHYNDDTDNPTANGGHQNVTLRAGAVGAGKAPLKFTTGPLTTAAEVGTIEFYNNRFYITQTTDTTNRRVIAAYDDTSGANGDIHFRDANANLVRLGIGGNNYVLSSNGSAPTWTAPGPSFNQVMAISSLRI